MTQYDVVIQGAGMAGLAFAAVLAPSKLRIAVVDAQPVPRWREEQMAIRVSAITAASERILRAVGAWDQILASRASPFRVIEAYDAEGGGKVRFDSAEIGEPYLGHIVENILVQQALYERLQRHDNVSFFIPAAIETLTLDDDGAEAVLEDGRRLQAALVVAADGARSPLRAMVGIGVDEREYGQLAVVGAIRTSRPHGEVARQRFLNGGPLALLPLLDGRCSIVWSLPREEAQRMLALGDDAFCQALTEASAHLLGTVLEIEERAAFPLRRQHAKQYCKSRFALIGDAAHVIHPLAGQGANLGFLDAAVLAERVADAAERGRDIGGLGTLRRYERARKGDNLAMQYAMDGFDRLFRAQLPALAGLRSLGFDSVDRLPPLKAFFMRQAMGEGRELPTLAR